MHIEKRVLRRVLLPPEAMRQRLRAFKTLTDGERGNMCGRFGLFAELDALAEQFNFDPSIMQDIYSPRWNIPPTVPVLTVQPPSSGGQPGKNTARLMRWGMTGARNPRNRGSGRPLFNARAETVHRPPSFRQPFRERRCLVPASGFYEWRKDETGGRTPVWFHREDEVPVAFAGVWSAERADDYDFDACAVMHLRGERPRCAHPPAYARHTAARGV